MERTRGPYRFDHVGSLLRPEALLNYRDKFKAGEITGEELRVHEDRCIRDVIEFQESWAKGSNRRRISPGKFSRRFHLKNYKCLVELGLRKSR